MNKMLANQFRPKRFSEVEGQEQIVSAIKKAITTQSLSQALLFHGPSGVGKTTIARIIAKSLNCEASSDGEPCLSCKSCQKIESETSLDLLEFDAAKNNGVNEIREIQDQVNSATLSSRYRVFILDEAHMLTTQASNSLLKTLEEPPKRVVFILATTELNKILPTIRSRCQKYALASLAPDKVRKRLVDICTELGTEIEPPALELIARGSRGGMREAVQFLQKVAGTQEKISLKDVVDSMGAASFDLVYSFLRHVATNNPLQILSYIENMAKDGISLTFFWEEWQQMLRAVNIVSRINDASMIAQLIPYDKSGIDQIVAFSKKLNRSKSLDIWKVAIETQNSLDLPSVAGRSRELIEQAALRMAEMEWTAAVVAPSAEVSDPAPNKSALKERLDTVKPQAPQPAAAQVPTKGLPVLSPVNPL